jgi:hypothetical protein
MTNNLQFAKATKEQARARIALIGPSGCGKTYTALKMAEVLGKKVALIDTENASASKYADQFSFDTLALTTFAPQTYVKAIEAAEQAGYDVLIIDSLSHAWAGKEGALQQVDRATVKYKGNSFAAWRDVTPHHNAFVDAMVWCKSHLVVTMRSKTEYVVQADAKGKMAPKKVGTAPIQRDGLEYEFDIVGDMDIDHNLVITKTRCPAVDGVVVNKPGHELAQTILDWLTEGTPPAEKPTEPKATEEPRESPETKPETKPIKKESTKVESGAGPQAMKLKLIAAAGMKENAGWTGPPTTDLVQKFSAVMNGVLGGDDERHTWLKWTYGAPTGSTKEVTGAKLQVVLDELNPTYTNKKWVPTNEEAVKSIKAMYQEALKGKGAENE